MCKKLIALSLLLALLCTGCGTISDDTKKTEKSTTEKKEITKVVMTSEDNYADGVRAIQFLGLKEFEKVKGNKLTDTPEKGKIYLVLFLQVNIKEQEEKMYFNYNYLSAEVDGEKTSYKALVNNPLGYDTLFKNYTFGQEAGCLVFEVPKDWKKLEITYTGLEDIAGNNLQMKFTTKDLKDPEEKYKVIPE